MTNTTQKSNPKNTLKAIIFSALFALISAFVLLALGVWVLEKIPKSERFEPIFVLSVQLLCGFIGGWISSLSKQNCFLRASSTAALFTFTMLLLSFVFLSPAPLPAFLSALPIIPAGIAGGCLNAFRKTKKTHRKTKRK